MRDFSDVITVYLPKGSKGVIKETINQLNKESNTEKGSDKITLRDVITLGTYLVLLKTRGKSDLLPSVNKNLVARFKK